MLFSIYTVKSVVKE